MNMILDDQGSWQTLSDILPAKVFEQPQPLITATRSKLEELPSELLSLIIGYACKRQLIHVQPDFNVKNYSMPPAVALRRTSRRLRQNVVPMRTLFCNTAIFTFGAHLTEQDIRHWLDDIGPGGISNTRRVVFHAEVPHTTRVGSCVCHRKLYIDTSPHPQSRRDAGKLVFLSKKKNSCFWWWCWDQIPDVIHSTLDDVPKWPDGALKLDAESFLSIWRALRTAINYDAAFEAGMHQQ